MKLSVLIPTHNRPDLFERCINSLLWQLGDGVEIIVNNDSDDITEIPHPRVKYFYNRYENLSLVYKFLLSQASGEYVYFLEDDDHLTPNFNMPLTTDLIVGNYMPTYNPPFRLKAMSTYRNGYHSPEKFKSMMDHELLQLSQFIFKRSTIADFEFPMDNNIHNDIKLVLHACDNSTQVQTLNKVIFYQTQDGNDNISFPETTSTLPITKSLDFL
jgi:glycosyltransferase involved in cell wall biosynthesis